MLFSALFAASAALLCAKSTPRQSAGAVVSKIGAIHVTGQKIFTAEQVIAAAALKAGQVFDVSQLNAAAERLGKSGAFSDVTYTYVSQGGLISVDFKVEEAKLHTCHFDNFVWLTSAEIDASLKRELPVYNGMAPETGEMPDAISGVLERLSKGKGIAVQVSRRMEQSAIGDPNWSHLYVADGANVPVQSLRFTGNLTVNPADLQKEASRLVGRSYSAFESRLFGSATIVPFYREHGYLQAQVDAQPPRILSHTEGSADYAVEVVYAIVEGSVYHWVPAEWSGNGSIDSAKLAALTGMKPNDVANGKKIDEGWAAVQREYSKSGYIEARVLPQPVLDEAQRLVHYRVTVAEGPQYRMQTLSVLGLPQSVADKLKGRWKLKTGEPYDGSYAMEFVKKEVLAVVQGAGTRGARVGIATSPNREQHTVDVTLKVQ